MLALLACVDRVPVQAADRHPNIVFVLADDLGYGDLGSYGQTKILTPNLDHLAAEGVRFTQHYAGSSVCAPSRGVLMTGRHPGHAFVRGNRFYPPEGNEPLPAGTLTLARRLQQAGYVTGAFGKWGLGGPGTTGDPLEQGISLFFGYKCQTHAHQLYPTYLWENDRRVVLDNPEIPRRMSLPAGTDPHDPRSYRAFSGQEYAPDIYTQRALRFIEENRERPFFLYYATVVPHLPLLVPDDSLAAYADRWEETPYVGDRGYLPQRTPHAAYAAMVSRLDAEVGRLMEQVRRLGLEEDTIFVFTSDNGPAPQGQAGTDSAFFRSAGSFRGLKVSLYEGGIRVPLLVRWPGKIPSGRVADRVTGFEDWMITLMDLAGLDASGLETDGVTFAPTLLGRKQPERAFLYREHPPSLQQSVRWGDWKGIKQFPRRQGDPPARLELYHLADDPAEQHDVASRHPDIVIVIEQLMLEQRVPSAAFPFPGLDPAPRG